MATVVLEKVKSPKGTSYKVQWDPQSHDLYVGGNHIGKANNATEAMYKAQAWAATRQ